MDVFAKHLLYLWWKLPNVSFAPAVERLLVTLLNSMACHDSFVTRGVIMFQEKGWNYCVCTYASECNFFRVALKLGDQMSKNWIMTIVFKESRNTFFHTKQHSPQFFFNIFWSETSKMHLDFFSPLKKSNLLNVQSGRACKNKIIAAWLLSVISSTRGKRQAPFSILSKSVSGLVSLSH